MLDFGYKMGDGIPPLTALLADDACFARDRGASRHASDPPGLTAFRKFAMPQPAPSLPVGPSARPLSRSRHQPRTPTAVTPESDADCAPAADACHVCRTLRDYDQHYAERILLAARKGDQVSEALLDSLGFCAYHTATLPAGLRTSTLFHARATAAATWLQVLFTDTVRYEDKLSDILFAAHSRCPACAYHRRIEGMLLSRLCRAAPSGKRALAKYLGAPLCLSHLSAVIRLLEPPSRQEAIRVQHHRLRDLVSHYGTWDINDYDGQVALPAPFLADGSHLAVLLGTEESLRRARRDRQDDLRDPAAEGNGDATAPDVCGCPVCRAGRDARRHWRERLARTVSLDQPLWLAFPTCAQHVIDCLHTPEPGIAYAAWSFYAHEQLRERHAPPVTARRKHRARSASWHLEPPPQAPAEPMPAPPRQVFCAACESIAIAQTRALLQYGRRASHHAAAPAFCLKHFADAYLLESDTHRRAALARDRMQALQSALDDDPIAAFGVFG